MVNEKMIELKNEEKYKLVNQFLFNYAFENDMYGEIESKGAYYQGGDELEIYTQFELKNVFIKGENKQAINNLEKELNKINNQN